MRCITAIEGMCLDMEQLPLRHDWKKTGTIISEPAEKDAFNRVYQAMIVRDSVGRSVR